MAEEFTEEGWIRANFEGGRVAYCQIEIRVTEAGPQPWQIRGSFGASTDDLR
jgi:hypothetical protein